MTYIEAYSNTLDKDVANKSYDTAIRWISDLFQQKRWNTFAFGFVVGAAITILCLYIFGFALGITIDIGIISSAIVSKILSSILTENNPKHTRNLNSSKFVQTINPPLTVSLRFLYGVPEMEQNNFKNLKDFITKEIRQNYEWSSKIEELPDNQLEITVDKVFPPTEDITQFMRKITGKLDQLSDTSSCDDDNEGDDVDDGIASHEESQLPLPIPDTSPPTSRDPKQEM